MLEGEEKPGDAGQHRAQKENRGYAVEAFSYEQPVEHNETGTDSDQADDDVQKGEG